MKRTAIWSIVFAAAFAATGCQTVQRFAWFKRDKAPDDASAVARSAKPELPSAQTSPQAVAVAGLTPATPPSSNNLAAAAPPVTGATAATAAAAGPPSPPPVSIPLAPTTSPATAAASATPASPFPTDSGLADKLVATPTTKPGATAGLAETTTVPAVPAAGGLTTPKPAAVAAAGPYDPNAYKPSTTATADDSIRGAANDVDRYAIGSTTGAPTAGPAASVGAASTPNTANTASSNVLQSDPADRYGSQRYSAPSMTSGSTPLPDPAAVAADRYSNPTLPSLPGKTLGAATPTAPIVGAAPSVAAAPSGPATNTPNAQSAIRLASAPGQYRPGRTSSYSGAVQQIPVEVATRPAPPATTATTPPAAAASPNQSWTPPASTAPAGARY